MFKFKFLVIGGDSRSYIIPDWLKAVHVTVNASDLEEATKKVKTLMGKPPSPFDKWVIRLQEVEEVGGE